MFKKIIYFALLCFMIIFMWEVNSTSKTIFNGRKNEIFLYKNSSETTVKKEADFIELFKKGESFVIDGEENIDEILKFYNAKIVYSEESQGGISYYCFSPDMKYSKTLFNKTVSLHIFIGNCKTVIGTPIIYGSF